MRWKSAWFVVLLLATAGAVAFVTIDPMRWWRRTGPLDDSHPDSQASVPQADPVPVALNRGPEVENGFRGDVHPLLAGSTRLEVSAHWTPVGKGRDELHRHVHPDIYSWFANLRPARQRHTYSARDFSAFLPETIGDVGQLWAIDADKMASILKQFHPQASMKLVAAGRRAGPNGAFAVLRAVSPTHLDIAFRVHAEFFANPEDLPPFQATVRVWYTPAYFSGRLLVNRQAGAVECFRLAVPTDKALNVHLTVEIDDGGDYRLPRDIVRVERMELIGGASAMLDKLPWTHALSLAEAERRLERIFYKFREIDWAPFAQAQERARRESRPIFAVVSWGAFEDQSC